MTSAVLRNATDLREVENGEVRLPTVHHSWLQLMPATARFAVERFRLILQAHSSSTDRRKRMSMRTQLILIAISCILSLSGCHCCGVTEHYADGIDDFADHCDFRHKLDGYYCEQLDVSRWCMNRQCPPCCCPQCQRLHYR